MKCYTTVVDGDDAILPHFVRHYLALGATSFPLLVYGAPDDMRRATATIKDCGGRPTPLAIISPAKFSAKHREAFIGARHPEGEWAFFCDLDELADLTAADVQRLISEGPPYVGGRWVDRIAEGGRLVDVRPDVPIEQQYPHKARLRQVWRMGDAVFVMSPRAPTLHHPNSCRWGCKHWPDGVPIVDVHHYRWQANVIERLERRLKRIAAVGKSGSPWDRRVSFMLRHVKKHNGIDSSLIS